VKRFDHTELAETVAEAVDMVPDVEVETNL
jgi:hypothetical protein